MGVEFFVGLRIMDRMKGLSFRVALSLVAVAVTAPSQGQLVRQSASSLNLPAQLPTSTGYATENALGSLTFSEPIDLAFPPGVTDKLFVIQRDIGIQMVDLNTMTKSTFMSLSSYLTTQGRPLQTNSENGILSLAFHPNYNQNGKFYLFYSISLSLQLHQRVACFTATGTPGEYNAATSADPATEAPLITQRDEASNHNGGDLAFGPDGYLYVSMGDEGGQRDTYDNSRHIAKDFFGGILRLDVDLKPGSLAPNGHDESSTGTVGDSAFTPGSYAIPPDNPFVALAQGAGTAAYNGFRVQKSDIRTEFFAIGFRNPWRMSFDPDTGRLFVGDVGQDNYEEINLVTSGFNGGWSWREGEHSHNPSKAPSSPPARFLGADPIYEYDQFNNGSGNDAVIYGTSVTGGVVYRGDRLPELFGKYLFCDYNQGFIVALTEGAGGQWTGERLGSDSRISGWGYDPRNGDALLCDLSNGQVKRLRRTGTAGTEPPATLSATGAFTNLATLTPSAGLVDYDPNVSFWSDYAIKSRWFAIRNGNDKVQFNADGSWGLPTGMVWVKHFDLETTRGDPASRIRLETRFLVKTSDDVYGLTYKWRADQSEADLVPEEGLTEAIPASSPAQTWRYPSRSECRACHTDAGGYALSFNTRQMNRAHQYGGQSQNQIEALDSAGYLDGPVDDPAELPALAEGDEVTVSLEWRVRSYLETNCAQCHQPGASAPGLWDARASTPTDLAHLIGGALINDGGDPANLWCVPGDVGHSMVLKRLQGAGIPRMPPLATSERDLAAETLLTDWINTALPSRESFAEWQVVHFGGTQSQEAQPDSDPDGDDQNNRLEHLLGQNPLQADAKHGPDVVLVNDGYSLSFEQPANRAALIETSTNLIDWMRWDEPGNLVSFPTQVQMRTLSGAMDEQKRFFRVRIWGP